MKRHALAALLSAGIGASPALAEPPAPPLPALGADLSATTVSGISSGGFLAAQLATAYSARFAGVGLIAAGPYYCAGTHPSQSLLDNAMTSCMAPAIPAVAASGALSLANATRFAAAGLIDPVQNLARQRVYAFSGASDRTVKTIVVDQVRQYYLMAGARPEQILYRKHPDAGHAIMMKDDDDVPCASTAPPYINNCGFVQSHELLAHLYGTGKPANAGAPAGRIVAFDQREFIRGSQTGMDARGYLYVPQYCTENACNVHVALHGCQQGAQVIGDRFYRGTGYNAYADTNRLIILYPQVEQSRGLPMNPRGCWDFWGYSNTPGSPPFYAKGAPQMAAIMAMIDRLGQPRGPAAVPPAAGTQP